MDTAAKVAIGVAVGTGVIAGVAYLSSRQRTLGRAAPAPSAGVPKPRALSESRSADGTTVKVYRKETLPIKERLAIIQDLVHRGTSGEDLPQLRQLALDITSGCPARDDVCESRAIYNYVRRNIRYTGDIAPHKLGRNGPVDSVDLFQSAKQTLAFKGGDCDDHTALVATLMILNGITTRLRVSSPYKWGSDNFTHIYPVVGLPKNNPKKWVTVDTTLPGENYGREASYAKALDVMA